MSTIRNVVFVKQSIYQSTEILCLQCRNVGSILTSRINGMKRKRINMEHIVFSEIITIYRSHSHKMSENHVQQK